MYSKSETTVLWANKEQSHAPLNQSTNRITRQQENSIEYIASSLSSSAFQSSFTYPSSWLIRTESQTLQSSYVCLHVLTGAEGWVSFPVSCYHHPIMFAHKYYEYLIEYKWMDVRNKCMDMDQMCFAIALPRLLLLFNFRPSFATTVSPVSRSLWLQ